jgi:hypothetical protein
MAMLMRARCSLRAAASAAVRPAALARPRLASRRIAVTAMAAMKEVSVKEARELSSSGAAKYLDVRSPQARAAGPPPCLAAPRRPPPSRRHGPLRPHSKPSHNRRR